MRRREFIAAHCSATGWPPLVRLPILIAVMIICLVVAQGAPAAARDANKSINTVTELLAALRKCWTPPPIASAHNGMEITVRFSIARDGSVFGKAAIRYESPDASNEKRMAYRISVAQAIERCVPFPITEALGNAIAGHPLNIKLTDRRKQRSASAETPIASADEIIE